MTQPIRFQCSADLCTSATDFEITPNFGGSGFGAKGSAAAMLRPLNPAAFANTEASTKLNLLGEGSRCYPSKPSSIGSHYLHCQGPDGKPWQVETSGVGFRQPLTVPTKINQALKRQAQQAEQRRAQQWAEQMEAVRSQLLGEIQRGDLAAARFTGRVRAGSWGEGPMLEITFGGSRYEYVALTGNGLNFERKGVYVTIEANESPHVAHIVDQIKQANPPELRIVH